MRANEENCIFVNFYKEEKNPVHGIKELFEKLSVLAKETETYKKYTKKI